MKNRINCIRNSLAIISILSLTYIVASHFLEKYFNLIFRDWVLALVIVILTFCGLIIEIVILIKLNNLFEKTLSISNMWKAIIHIISTLLIILVNFYILLVCIFIIGTEYEEVGVETYNGNKYVVRNTSGWLSHHPSYNYHLYINIFVYEQDVKYSEDVRLTWKDYLEADGVDEDEENQSNTMPDISDIPDISDTTEKKVIEIIPSNVEYVQKIDENLDYGFYLIDRAAHQYSYGFVQSDNEGLSWELIYQFPANSEMYYGHFLDKELGFINFGSSDELSLFMTNDGGLTWRDVLINLPEENKSMLYVQDITKSGENIELILGVPSWSNSNQSIKYISVDKGLSWDLQNIN